MSLVVEPPRSRIALISFLPLVASAALAAEFLWRLFNNNRLPSTLVAREACEFALPPIEGMADGLYGPAAIRQIQILISDRTVRQ